MPIHGNREIRGRRSRSRDERGEVSQKRPPGLRGHLYDLPPNRYFTIF